MRALGIPICLAAWADCAIAASIGDLNCTAVTECSSFGTEAALECDKGTAVFEIRADDGDKVTFGWVGQKTSKASETRREGFSLFEIRDEPNMIETLVIGDDLKASYSLVATIPGVDWTSFTYTTLACVRP